VVTKSKCSLRVNCVLPTCAGRECSKDRNLTQLETPLNIEFKVLTSILEVE
jgi:hypothetical protein